MKILTVCQPYADLIARGVKRIENRSWATNYRGPLLIHAGKSRAWLSPGDVSDYVYGAVVAVCVVKDCVRLEKVAAADREYANGPWCWVLGSVVELPAPLKWTGAQGLRDAPAELSRAVGMELDAMLAGLDVRKIVERSVAK